MNSVRKAISRMMLGVFVAAGVVGAVSAAPRHDDRDWRAHEVRAHRYWHGHSYGPHEVYAPPVVYAPPPVQEAPGINLVLPLNFH